MHGSLLQVRHLLEAHGSSLQSCEAQAVLPQTAALLLERIWLATPLSAAKAVRAAFLRAAGALLSAAHSEQLNGGDADTAAVALARGVMGVCQEALIGQDLPAAPAHLPRTSAILPTVDLGSSVRAQAAAQPALAAGSAAAGSNAVPDSRTGKDTEASAAAPSQSQEEFQDNSREFSTLPSNESMSDAAGADGADMMRSVFLKEAALLYFSPAMQRLTRSGSTGVALNPSQHSPEQSRAPGLTSVKDLYHERGNVSRCRTESCLLMCVCRCADKRGFCCLQRAAAVRGAERSGPSPVRCARCYSEGASGAVCRSASPARLVPVLVTPKTHNGLAWQIRCKLQERDGTRLFIC